MKNPSLQFRRLVAVVVLPMFLFGCTTWEVQTVSPEIAYAFGSDFLADVFIIQVHFGFSIFLN